MNIPRQFPDRQNGPGPRSSVAPPRTGAAFTLPEMLAVAAIIVIIISILLPSLSKAKVAVHRTTCASNLHQMGIANRSYTIDYSRVFPPHRHLSLNTGRDWHNLLEKYGNSPELSRCPALSGQQVDFGVKWNWKYDAHYIGYGYNGFFLGLYSHPNGYSGHYLTGRVNRWTKTTDANSPSQLIVFADSHPKSSGGVDYGVSLTLWWPSINGATEGINGRRHQGAGVVSFGDGHSEVVIDVEKKMQPPFDGSSINIEYWDPKQRKS